MPIGSCVCIVVGRGRLWQRMIPVAKELRRDGRHVIDRCNLTILLAPGYTDLPQFLADHQVEVVASLPPTPDRHLPSLH